MVVLKEFPIDDILQHATNDSSYRLVIDIEGVEYSQRMNSERLLTFQKNKKCCVCGLEGTVARLEKSHQNDKTYHFNMYAIEDNEMILMTKDHIIPKSLGGSNTDLSNFQTMCCLCNTIKGNTDMTLLDILLIRTQLHGTLAEKRRSIHEFQLKYLNQNFLKIKI